MMAAAGLTRPMWSLLFEISWRLRRVSEIANLESYIRIVKEKATLRMTMFACQ
jgi:hypothetical protein